MGWTPRWPPQTMILLRFTYLQIQHRKECLELTGLGRIKSSFRDRLMLVNQWVSFSVTVIPNRCLQSHNPGVAKAVCFCTTKPLKESLRLPHTITLDVGNKKVTCQRSDALRRRGDLFFLLNAPYLLRFGWCSKMSPLRLHVLFVRYATIYKRIKFCGAHHVFSHSLKEPAIFL